MEMIYMIIALALVATVGCPIVNAFAKAKNDMREDGDE